MAEKEYIEREALKSKLKNMDATSPNKVYQTAREDMIYYFIPKIIDEIPSADVAPVRHGRWINENFYTRCSVCGNMAIYDKYGQEVESDYCPNCGARMDGDTDANGNDNKTPET